jgi:2'-5' RNA ligase/GNAT superfamily N-acetyltransferase
MARQRLGVVLRVPQPLATELDGLRRALGDPMRERVVPHATLVPPVNVHDRDLPAALDVVRAAAADVEPLTLRLGPGATFHPAEPVVYLAVGGDVDGFERLRREVLRPPLERTVHDPWVPHVTLSSNLHPDRIPGALELLAGYEIDVRFDHVDVLSEREGRVWRPVADAPLGTPAAHVGRGSLPLELHVSGQLDMESAALLAVESEPHGRPFAVGARSEGTIVAAAWGWSAGARLELADLCVAGSRRRLGIGRHVLAAVEHLARDRGCTHAGTSAPVEGGPPALLVGAGWERTGDADVEGRSRWVRRLDR